MSQDDRPPHSPFVDAHWFTAGVATECVQFCTYIGKDGGERLCSVAERWEANMVTSQLTRLGSLQNKRLIGVSQRKQLIAFTWSTQLIAISWENWWSATYDPAEWVRFDIPSPSIANKDERKLIQWNYVAPELFERKCGYLVLKNLWNSTFTTEKHRLRLHRWHFFENDNFYNCYK